jgi:hypothetical protein
MIKGRMPRNLPGLMMAIILVVGIFLCAAVLPGTGLKDSPGRIVSQYSPLLPDEIIVYEHANYVGNYYVFRLEPGMRQKLVPDLKNFNDVISSIQVGSQVGVMVFEHGGFRDEQSGSGVLSEINPSFGTYDDSLKVLPGKFNDSISSLIVFRKGQEVMGVMLYDQHWDAEYSQFFPLSELEIDTETKYSGLGPMDDDANEVALYPRDPKSPGYGKVHVILHEHPDFTGKWITLPGADGSIPPNGIFKMNSYQFDDIGSSLIVRWIGPPPPLKVQVSPTITPPAPSTAHATAPPAPDTKTAPSDRTPPAPGTEAAKAPSDKTAPLPPASKVMTTDISGQWNSNIGAVYEIQQSGNNFTWSAPSLNQSGTGTISGTSVIMSGPGWTVKGIITEADSSGRPTKIVGENGVILFRTT